MISILKSILFSFWCAFKGIGYAVLHERNLRIHMVLGVTMLFFSHYYSFSAAEMCVLILTVALVLVTELVNTAVEKTVDLESPHYHDLAKIAKDVAAGAVVMSALASVAVGVYLFWDLDILREIWYSLRGEDLLWAALYVAAALIFIFFRPQHNIEKPRKETKNRRKVR